MTQTSRKERNLLIEALEIREVFSATYWIDPVAGNDKNDGLSAQAALKSVNRIVSQYESLKPADHIDLKPGDTVLLMPGDHQFAYRYGEGQWQGLFLRGVHGSADQPITIRGLPGARVDNRTPDGSEMSSIYVLQSSHIIVEGLDVTSYGSAITVADANDIVVQNNYIHDVDGIAANNLSGVYLTGVQEVTVKDNLFTDNYDRKRIGNPNNRHIVVFGGVDISILGNTMFNADPNAGMAVDYKHLGGLPVEDIGFYEVAYNTVINAAGTAIGTAAPNSHIHHNLLIDSGSIRVADFGGTNQLANELIEYNTIVNNNVDRTDGAGLSYYPNEYAGYPLGSLQWTNNLVVDNRILDSHEESTLSVDHYGPDGFYDRVIGGKLIKADGNLYQSRDIPRFDLYGANGGNYGTKGAALSFSQWQAAGYDVSGATTNIQMDQYYRDLSSSGVQAGIYADSAPRLTVLLSQLDIDESGPNSSTKLRLVRSGTDLSKSLPVSLAVSQVGEIETPLSVAFPAGVQAIEVQLNGVMDRQVDETEGIQIRVSAEGYSEATTWLRLHDKASSTDPGDSSGDTNPTNGIFQVPGLAGHSVRLQSTVLDRWAQYNNEMGIAYVDDATGRVGNLFPSDPGWTQALLSRSQHKIVLSSGVNAGDIGQIDLESGKYFVFYLVQDNTTSNWLSRNPANALIDAPLVFTSITSSNPDKYDHVREDQQASTIDLAWEDLTFGGDKSFMDLVVRSEFSHASNNYQVIDDVLTHQGRDEAIVDVLANDRLPSGSKITSVTQPEIGSVRIAETGDNLIYTPSSNGYGPVQFRYTVQADSQVLQGNVLLNVKKAWTNFSNPVDVNQDGKVTPLDALLVINALVQHGETDLERYPQGAQAEFAMIDANADHRLTLLDALVVIGGLLNRGA